jgi:hypothetical protein
MVLGTSPSIENDPMGADRLLWENVNNATKTSSDVTDDFAKRAMRRAPRSMIPKSVGNTLRPSVGIS